VLCRIFILYGRYKFFANIEGKFEFETIFELIIAFCQIEPTELLWRNE